MTVKNQHPSVEESKYAGLGSTLPGIAVDLFLAVRKCVARLIGHSFFLIADGIAINLSR